MYTTKQCSQPAQKRRSSLEVRQRRMPIAWPLLWTILIPAILANALFWGYYYIDDLFFHRTSITLGANLWVILLAALPFIGVLYGTTTGYLLYVTTPGEYRILHPVVQALFQPFWFIVSVASGLCVVGAVLGIQ
jgi:hypothetical protein